MAIQGKTGAPQAVPASHDAAPLHEQAPAHHTGLSGALADGFQKAVSYGKQAVETAGKVQENFDATNTARDAHEVASEAAALAKGGEKAVEQGEEHVSRLSSRLAGASVVVGVATLPGKVVTAAHDVIKAVKSGSADDRNEAIDSVSDAAETAVATGDAGKTVFQAVKQGTAKAAERAAAKTGERAGEKALEEGGVKVAERVGEKVALEGGAKAVGRAAALAVPGVSVAFAAADAAHFYSVMHDPHATTGKKWAAGITAFGSAIACIPAIGLVGDAISVGGTIAEGFTH